MYITLQYSVTRKPIAYIPVSDTTVQVIGVSSTKEMQRVMGLRGR